MNDILAKFLRRRTVPPVIQRLKVEPGDVLVAAVPHTLGPHECERLRVCMQENLPGVDVLVVSDNVTLSVIVKGTAAPAVDALRAAQTQIERMARQ